MARVGVLFVHGMGNLGPGYAEELRAHIVEALADRHHDVAFESVHYRDPLEAAQTRLWEQWKPHTGGIDDPDLAFLRYGLVVSGFGDVLAYLQTHRAPIQLRVEEGLARLRDRLDDATRDPLVVVAHSLGVVVAEDYVRRHQDSAVDLVDSAFVRGETLTSLYTLGSPLPLFRLTIELPPVRVPGKSVAPALRDTAEWVNFHSRSDVFGMPMSILGPAYADVVEDVPSSNRGIVGGHLGYWRNVGIARRIASGLVRILDAHA